MAYAIRINGGILYQYFLMIYLFIRNARRVEKAMAPILRGIRHLSVGKPVHLEETGELAEINAGLNKAGDYLLKRIIPVQTGSGEFPMIYAHRFL